MIQQLLSPELVHAIGWTLVHSLWQAAVFAVALGLLLIALRKFSARARYTLSIGMLAAFFLTVLMTFGNLYQSNSALLMASATSPFSLEEGLGERAIAAPVKSVSPTTSGSKSTIENRESRIENRIISYYNAHLPLIVTLWLMGVLILQLRFLGQLAYLQRLKNYGAERFPARLAPMLQELEAAIGISKPVRYLSSFRIGSPFTAGWWRPVVLFPATLLAELNEPELRTIIAHELAHVKRHDFLVNLAQTLVCILFFYHPAVWWMSARIEDEREHCCDDLAVEVTGERVGYAKTLIQLKEREAGPAMAMGFLGKGGGFKQRVTRLLSGYLGTGTYGEGFTSAVIIACIMAAAVTLSAQSNGAEKASANQPVETEKTNDLPPSDSPPANLPNEPNAANEPNQPNRPNSNHLDVFEAGPERFGLPGDDSTALVFFLEAIDDGNVELVRYFIKQGVDVNAVDKDGWTPLMVAASENQVGVLRVLIAAGANVNYVNHNGWTALIEAADEGATECARYLLKSGAKTDLPGTQRSAADLAASEGHPEILQLLAGAGADLTGSGRSSSPLHEAAEEGKLNIVKSLLSSGADAGARNRDGRAALSYAAEEGHTSVVEYLLRSGSNVNDADNDRRTALSFAAEERNVDIVNMLIAAGAETMIKDLDGMTALDYAVEELGGESLYWHHSDEGSRPQTNASGAPMLNHPLSRIIHSLIGAGATSDMVEAAPNGLLIIRQEGDNQNDRNEYRADPPLGPSGKVPSGKGGTSSQELVQAIAEGQNKKIDYLIARGDNLNGITGNGRTPLTEASYRNFNIHTMQLLRGGADINRADGNGYTPLTMAVEREHFSTVESLLSAGAQPNFADAKGRSAKAIALEANNKAIIELLNDAGASITAVSSDGISPLSEAALAGEIDVLNYLLEQGANPNAGTGCPPVFLAAKEGHAVAVRMLLRYKASPDARWSYWDTDHFYRPVPGGGGSVAIYENAPVLVMALTQVDGLTVKALLRGGADVNETCRKARFAGKDKIDGERAAEMTGAQLAQRFTTVYKADGWTPLMEAVESGKTELVSELLKAGAEKTMKTSGGITALSLAKELGFTKIADMLD